MNIVILLLLVLGVATSVAQTVPAVPTAKHAPSHREEMMEHWSYTEQRRMARYRVLMPSSVRPYERLPLVMMLHGNGNTPDVMIRLARELDLGRVIVICPEGPYVKLAETIVAHSEKLTAMQIAQDAPDTLLPRTIDLSAQWYMDALADARRTLPVDTTRGTVLIGFSQGGFFAHVLMTRHPAMFSHVVSICASMYAAGGVVERYPAVVPFPVKVLVAHGTTDEVVAFQTGELIHSQLDRAGVVHQWLPFEGGHWPTRPVLDAIRALVR